MRKIGGKGEKDQDAGILGFQGGEWRRIGREAGKTGNGDVAPPMGGRRRQRRGRRVEREERARERSAVAKERRAQALGMPRPRKQAKRPT